MILVYYTGSIETPLYMLFIFHMIIGSLILPNYVILGLALIISFFFSLVVGLEYFDIIPHHHLFGIHEIELKDNFNYIFSSLGLFIFTIFAAVLLTSRIAKRLYRREQELIETLKKLDEAEKAKQRYTMAVVHEIKSPIVAAQSIIEIVKNGYLGDINVKIKEKLERTINRTNEALQLINNILRISKLKLLGEVSIEKINIREIIENILDQKNEVAENRNITLNFISEKLNDEFIDGDNVLFELIASNIIGNAIKYNVEGGKVIIKLESIENKILFEVSDNGIGIPESELKMIFHQFYRATNLPTKRVEGSGLGLSLVKEIVERLSGTINIYSPSELKSNENPGTTVKITLPIKQNISN
jgi:signal transduction histidine kinase